MNRRELFAALGAAVVIPGELIVPKRTIFLPPKGGWRPVSGHNFTIWKTPPDGPFSPGYYSFVMTADGPQVYIGRSAIDRLLEFQRQALITPIRNNIPRSRA